MGIARNDPPGGGQGKDAAVRQWLRWLLLFWIVAAAVMIAYKWNAIRWFALSDTDDNMRMSQVRAWLHGQAWFDLRQYKLDPPGGADIHWSRLVDLPIAGLILLVRPIFGGVIAEQAAVTIAPLLAFALALFAVALTVRRLIEPAAFALGAAILMCGQSTLLMFMPLRIDHHGWQLAFLALAVAGTTDRNRARGGVTTGLATAASLTIGLEMLPYLAVAGAGTVLRWVAAGDEAARLRSYGAALAAGSAAGFLGFASYANRAPVCDALSPVWLSATLAAGAVAVMLAGWRTSDWRLRLAAAAAAGAAIAVGFAMAWPDCLGRPEGVSAELDRLWLRNVREAKPLYLHPFRIALPVVALPVMGLIGAALALWRTRGTALFAAWATPALLGLFSAAMLLWQTRAGPAAQLLAVPGAAALGWAILPAWARHRLMLVRVFGTVIGFLIVSGLAVYFIVNMIPQPVQTTGRKAVATANGRCPTLPALRPIAKLPAATILTFADLGPRLITVTHHRAIAGPYHRNGAAILDVHHAFRGSPEIAHDVMRRHGATLLLLCPGMSESTIYAAQARQGFYARLMRGQVPDWLERVPLPEGSPFRLWRRRD
ncbi:MAG: hypothetical protein JWL91_2775 [Sphingomonas bacterium]|nr:AcrB/AcrD/AcrF family protein [Sphingomonas bacterium]MDB5690899.1 hypothetical protein [Sphingomonas bacterium]